MYTGWNTTVDIRIPHANLIPESFPYPIVAEIHDPHSLEAARLVGGDEAVFIDKRETISRLIVQASRQSGASVVYTELLDFEGDEVYFRTDDNLVGKRFGDALFAYDDCSVIGLRLDGSVVLNPHPELPMTAPAADNASSVPSAMASSNCRREDGTTSRRTCGEMRRPRRTAAA